MTIYLESHKILEINKILVKDYYTAHHNNALTIALHKNMSFPQPKDVNYILPKMNIPHLIINTKEAHPDHGIPPPHQGPLHLSKSMAHIHTPSGTILGSIPYPKLLWLWQQYLTTTTNSKLQPPKQGLNMEMI